MDFMRDTLSSGRVFRTFNLVDDFTRECLVIEVDTSLGGERVVSLLERDYITPAVWWVPSLTWMPWLRHGEKPEASRFRFHLVGGLGAERQRHRDDGERPLRPLWKLSAGLSIDLSRPAPDPPR